jgi:hypothetical protein
MIYLIGGAPRLGKSTIAKCLQEKISVSSISTDAIRAIVFQLTDPSRRVTLLPCCVPVTEISKQFRLAAQDWVNLQKIEAHTLHQSLIAFVSYYIRTGEDLILEGVHILPTLVHELRILAGTSTVIKTIFISDLDEGNVLSNFSYSTNRFNWLVGFNIETLKAVARSVVEFSRMVEQDSDESMIYHRTQDFNHDVEQIISILSPVNT